MKKPHLMTLVVLLASLFASVAAYAEMPSASLLERTDFTLSISEGKYSAEKVADEVTRQREIRPLQQGGRRHFSIGSNTCKQRCKQHY